MASLILSKTAVVDLLATRKMVLNDIIEFIELENEKIIIKNLEDLFHLSKITCLPESAFISSQTKTLSELKKKVSISRSVNQYERVKDDADSGSYHYRHVLTTPFDHNLLLLRTSPLSSKEKIKLNTGHLVKEVVYVLNGKVGVVWRGKQGGIRYSELGLGDSIFIDSWVPHAFYKIEPESQILAIDYY